MLKRIDGSTLNPDGLAPNALQMYVTNKGAPIDQYTPSVNCLGFNTLHLTIRTNITQQNVPERYNETHGRKPVPKRKFFPKNFF